jgi:hypothetical protein
VNGESRPEGRPQSSAPQQDQQLQDTPPLEPAVAPPPPPTLDLRGDLHGHVVEFASDRDRVWFESNPNAHERHRPAIEHEFCDPRSAPDCVPLFDVEPGEQIRVRVVSVRPGVRLRQPYLISRKVA